MNDKVSVPVWVGSWGEYVIPPELRDVRIRSDGWVDLRQKRAADLLEWAVAQDGEAALAAFRQAA